MQGWDVEEDVSDWGEPMGVFDAVSPIQASTTGEGARVRLRVWDCNKVESRRYRMGRTFDMVLEFDRDPGLERGIRSISNISELHLIGVEVNDEYVVWSGHYNFSPPYFMVFEDVLEELYEAKSLTLKLPTEQRGELVYKFNIRGMRRAIDKACPDAF